MSEMMEAITAIGRGFEEFKKVNDQMLEEERKGNLARHKELAVTLEKINDDLSQRIKDKDILEKRFAQQQERLEILEALNERPRTTIQEKIKGEHKDAFLRWVRSRGTDVQALQKQEELVAKAREVKDVSIGTAAAGGYAVPEEISRAVDTLLPRLSAITQFVKNVEVGTSDYKELVTVHESGMYSWAGETDSRSATTEPLLRERTPTWGELYAYPKASNWSLQDIFFDVVEWLTEAIGEGMSQGLSAAIYNGNGSSKPTGFVNTSPTSSDDYASPMRAAAALQYVPITSPSSPFTSSGITPDTIINLVYKLAPRYRGNARFAMNTVTQGHVRKLKDTNNQYLWQPSLQAGQPDTLLGYQLFTWEDLGNPTSANAYPIAFGDFSKAYVLVRRPVMEMVVDKVTAPGFTNFYVARRYGGIVKNNDAVKLAKVSIS